MPDFETIISDNLIMRVCRVLYVIQRHEAVIRFRRGKYIQTNTQSFDLEQTLRIISRYLDTHILFL